MKGPTLIGVTDPSLEAGSSIRSGADDLRSGTSWRSRDFTMPMLGRLIDALKRAGYDFRTITMQLREPRQHVVLLRHDVDDRKLHSLAFARFQHDRGVAGTYYFRMVPQSFDPSVVKEVHAMGHEVGFHYEEMDLCNGDADRAFDLFRRNLERLRAVVPVTSICMHGSPRSRHDNKDIWKKYSYRDLGIIGEPYLDLDFSNMGYFTDTGRCWDGDRYSVRDRVRNALRPHMHHTLDMVHAIEAGRFPDNVMLTFHPQRWTDSGPLWLRDSVVQFAKNQVKYGLIKWRALLEQRTS